MRAAWSSAWRSEWRIAAACVLLLSALVYTPLLSRPLSSADRVAIAAISVGYEVHHAPAGSTAPASPLTKASLRLDWMLFGPSAFGFRQTNILLHVAATALLICLLRRALDRRSAAVIGGVLFALQPAQMSAVATVSGRGEALAVLFALSFAYLLLLTRQAATGRRTLLLIVAAAAYAAGVLTSVSVAPVILLVVPAFRWLPEGFRVVVPVNQPRRERHAAMAAAAVCAAVGLAALTWNVSAASRGGRAGCTDRSWSVERATRSAARGARLLGLPYPEITDVDDPGDSRTPFVVASAAAALLLVPIYVLRRVRRIDPPAAWFAAYTVSTTIPAVLLGGIARTYGTAPPVGSFALPGIGVAALAGWAISRHALQRPTGVPILALYHPATIALTLWYGAVTLSSTADLLPAPAAVIPAAAESATRPVSAPGTTRSAGGQQHPHGAAGAA